VSSNRLLAVGAAALLAVGIAACGSDDNEGGSSSSGGGAAASSDEQLSGNIRIDGSSTVFPFAQAAAELFSEEQPNVKVTVGEAGTGGGFEKFCAGETDISDASRPIKEDDDKEAPACEKAGVKYGQVQIANDGIAVVTNKDLKVDCLTTDELKKLWNKGSKVQNLSEVKSGLPNTKLSLYGPGTDSGTFDFFTAEINGEEDVTREDYQASEDDNQLVQGVAGDAGGLGYFGFSYFEGNQDKLNLVGVDSGSGCVKPAKESIQDGSYKPLSRPLFMYPKAASLAKPHVKAFMDFVVANQEKIAEAAKIVPLTAEQATKAKDELQKAESAT
jgi:phosphate transport system substrate-binding protein